MGWVPENTPSPPPPQQDDILLGETGGFQWLTMSSSTISDAKQPQEVPLEKKNTNESVAISNRSWHSDGSGNDDDDERNPSSPWRRWQHNNSNRSRLRSRTQSPTMLTSHTTRRGKSPSTPTHSLSSSDDGDYKIKNARDVLEGSISAVINFLKSAGVPKPSTDQLERNLEMGRWYATMVRSMDYIHCVDSKNEDDLLAKVHLTVNAWESLCRFKALEYRRAYKHVYRIRYESRGSREGSGKRTRNTSATIYNSSSNSSSSDGSSGNRSSGTLSMTLSSSAGTPAEIQQAIERQIQVAEQCASCQKKLYVVHKWQQRVLQRTHKAAVIEPQGYQAIRCL